MRLNLMICLVLDGTVRNHDGSLNEEALVLAKSLATHQRLAVLLDQEDPAPDEHWLKINGLIEYTHLVPMGPEELQPKEDRRLLQVAHLRSQRYSVSYVVEPDPDIATHLYKHNIPVLLCVHPQYSLPQARPDYRINIRPWDDLVEEIEQQRAIRAEKDRQEVES